MYFPTMMTSTRHIILNVCLLGACSVCHTKLLNIFLKIKRTGLIRVHGVDKYLGIYSNTWSYSFDVAGSLLEVLFRSSPRQRQSRTPLKLEWLALKPNGTCLWLHWLPETFDFLYSLELCTVV